MVAGQAETGGVGTGDRFYSIPQWGGFFTGFDPFGARVGFAHYSSAADDVDAETGACLLEHGAPKIDVEVKIAATFKSEPSAVAIAFVGFEA